MHCWLAWQLARDHFHPIGGGRRSAVFNPATEKNRDAEKTLRQIGGGTGAESVDE
jgi:hypothetical protein